MSRKPNVAIIIVNWNGLAHLKLLLPSLSKQGNQWQTVYIVDNHSTDQSVSYIKKTFPAVKLIALSANLGFSGGNNRGIEQALADGHDYIFLLNNDTKVKPNLISRLVDFMEGHPRVGIAQPKLLLLDHPERIDSCGSWLSRTGFLLHYGVEELDQPKYNKNQPMFTIKGAAMMIRRQTLVDVGLFDHDFFAYFEETDLCWRAWLAGWKVYYAPVSVVYHLMGGSTKLIGSPVINYHSYKNRINSLIKNLALINLVWILPLHLILIISFSFAYFLTFHGRSGWSIYRAIGWNIMHLPATLKQRQAIQQSRIISDRQLFPIIMRPIPWKDTVSFAFRIFTGKRKTEIIAQRAQSKQ